MSLESATLATTDQAGLSYRRSWQDRLQERIERAPLPSGITYLLLWSVPVLALVASGWVQANVGIGYTALYYANLWGSAVLALAMMHFLDRSACAALERFKPALTATEEQVASIRFNLTTLPAGKAAFAGAIGLAIAAIEIATLPQDVVVSLGLFSSPLVGIIEGAMFALGWVFFATLVYHTFHQLNVVRRIYRDHSRINLFRLDPIHSFSWLTARTALAIALIPYSYFLVSSYLYASEPRPEWVLAILGIMVVAAVLFAWPLLGVHNVLSREKTRLQREASIRLEAAIEELHRAADAREYANMDGLNKLIASLTMEQAAIERISTWPWRPETPRLLFTALLLPLIAFIGQRVVAVTLGL